MSKVSLRNIQPQQEEDKGRYWPQFFFLRSVDRLARLEERVRHIRNISVVEVKVV